MRWRLLILLSLVGCIRPGSRQCANGLVCPANLYCSEAGSCVTEEQLAACANSPDDQECELLEGIGRCEGGVCTLLTCGDGALQGTEYCDGDAWPPPTDSAPSCLDLGGDRGRITCSAACTIDLSSCEHLVWQRSFTDVYAFTFIAAVPSTASERLFYLVKGLPTQRQAPDNELYLRTGDKVRLVPEVPSPRTVSATSESDVWVAAETGVFHFDGSSWSLHKEGDYAYVWASGPNDVWAQRKGLGRTEHFDGSDWKEVADLPEMTDALVWGFAPGDVIVGGLNGGTEALYNFDGEQWAIVELGGAKIRPRSAVRLANGTLCLQGADNAVDNLLWCNDGSGFKQIALNQVSMIASDSVGRLYAVGATGLAYVYDGDAFLEVVKVTYNSLYALARAPDGTVVATGEQGVWLDSTESAWTSIGTTPGGIGGRYFVWASDERAILVANSYTSVKPVAWEFDGREWVGTIFDIVGAVKAITGTSTGVAYASLDHSLWSSASTGAAWQNIFDYPGEVEQIFSMTAHDADGIYLVAKMTAGFSLLRYAYDGSLSELYTTSAVLHDVSAGEQAVFVVGEDGLFVRHTSSQTEVIDSGTSADLLAVRAFADDHVVLAGAGGKLLLYNGSSVSAYPSPTQEELVALGGTGPTDVFALGQDSSLFHYDGVSWTPVRPTFVDEMTSIAVTDRIVHITSTMGRQLAIARPGPWTAE